MPGYANYYAVYIKFVIIYLLRTVRVHNVQTGTHISGYRSYSEQATDFKLLTDILDI